MSELIFEHYAHGKLLLSGEYFVLDGAKALAVPAKFGQYFRVYNASLKSHTEHSSGAPKYNQDVEASQSKLLKWKSFDVHNAIWFEGNFSIEEELSILNSSDKKIAEKLLEILNAALQISGLAIDDGLEIHTSLEFPNHWGLGSSSTLIASIADWFAIDPYELLDQSFGGSGYDLACATFDSPLFFERKPNEIEVTSVELDFSFEDHIYFVHLGKKQNSREGIQHYRKLPLNDKEATINLLSKISESMSSASSVEVFIELIEQHEQIISQHLQLPKVKDLYFSDFNGGVKSLGAWGGDFVMAIAHNKTEIKAYFKTKGYATILSYDEMVY